MDLAQTLQISGYSTVILSSTSVFDFCTRNLRELSMIVLLRFACKSTAAYYPAHRRMGAGTDCLQDSCFCAKSRCQRVNGSLTLSPAPAFLAAFESAPLRSRLCDPMVLMSVHSDRRFQAVSKLLLQTLSCPHASHAPPVGDTTWAND